MEHLVDLEGELAGWGKNQPHTVGNHKPLEHRQPEGEHTVETGLTFGQGSLVLHSWPNTQRSTDFWAWMRFSASSQTTERGPSITSSVTSSPRCAGRQ